MVRKERKGIDCSDALLPATSLPNCTGPGQSACVPPVPGPNILVTDSPATPLNLRNRSPSVPSYTLRSRMRQFTPALRAASGLEFMAGIVSLCRFFQCSAKVNK